MCGEFGCSLCGLAVASEVDKLPPVSPFGVGSHGHSKSRAEGCQAAAVAWQWGDELCSLGISVRTGREAEGVLVHRLCSARGRCCRGWAPLSPAAGQSAWT